MSQNRLLIVDDDLDFAAYIGRVAGGLGFEVQSAAEPAIFRSLVDTWVPDVIILDLQMPREDGIELLGDLAERKCQAEILVTSGMDRRTLDSAMRYAAEIGLNATTTIAKPVRLADLRAILGSLVSAGAEVSAEELRDAIRNENLFLVYQPKVETRTGTVVGVEALVRWRLENGEIRSPVAFVPVAEQSDVIHELTDWVVDSAVRQLELWNTLGHPLDLAVNISARNLTDPGLPNRLAEICRDRKMSPERVTLELTETATMTDRARMMEVLTRFRIKGFKLSIDDFGTGYSSLVQLRRLPFSELKIDRAFVTNLDTNEESRAITRTIVDMARNLGLSSTAEGVENSRSLAILRELGCDTVQGFGLFPPLEVAALPSVVGANALAPDNEGHPIRGAHGPYH